MDRQMEYLRQLQERNRMKKLMSEKSGQQQQHEELEKGFTTHFRGVHAAKEAAVAPKVISRSIKGSKPLGSELARRLQGLDRIQESEQDQISPRPWRHDDHHMEHMEQQEQADDDMKDTDYENDFEPSDRIRSPLLADIQTLSVEQKRVLLQLLQDSLISDTSPAAAFSAALPGQTVVTEQVSPSKPAEPVAQPSAAASSEEVLQSQPQRLQLVLRLLAAHGDARQVALTGLRLRYYFHTCAPSARCAACRPLPSTTSSSSSSSSSACSSLYIPCSGLAQSPCIRYVDLLHRCPLRVKAGLQALQSADLAHAGRQLLGTATSLGVWKAALPAYGAVELSFEEEDLQGMLRSALPKGCKEEEEEVLLLLCNLKLLLWNSASSDVYGALRDIDVIVNGRSLGTSSVVPAAAEEVVTVRRAALVPCAAAGGVRESSPSLLLDLFPPPAATAEEVVEVHEEVQQVAGTASIAERSSSRPDWLPSTTSSSAQPTSAPSTPKRPQSGRRARKEAESKETTISSASPAGAKRASRRSRASAAAAHDEEVAVDIITAVTPSSSSRDVGRGDGGLRRSLEALSFAEQHNFNRLPEPRMLSPDPDSRSGSSQQLGLGQRTSSEVRSSSRRRRAERIEDVHSKVSSALTDLADMLHALPVSPKPAPVRSPIAPTADAVSTADSLPAAVPITVGAGATPLSPAPVPVPSGSRLRLEVLSTWGDGSYLGLNGIEVFDRLLALVPVVSLHAYPRDLALLPGYEDDPRRLSNLTNGHNACRDDLLQWLAPQAHLVASAYPQLREEGEEVAGVLGTVTLTFAPTAVAAVRIFNFNKSRTHNQRGVRHCRLYLDDRLLFDGEIKKASALSTAGDCHVIAFASDLSLSSLMGAEEDSSRVEAEVEAAPLSRPPTALASAAPPLVDRMRTSEEQLDGMLQELARLVPSSSSSPAAPSSSSFSSFSSAPPPRTPRQQQGVRSLSLHLLSNYGHPSFLGLSGVQLLGPGLVPINITPSTVSCDTSSAELCRTSPAVLVADVLRISVDETHSWCAPFTHPSGVRLHFTLSSSTAEVVALRIWNYNARGEGITKGVRKLLIVLEGAEGTLRECVALLRPAPGHDVLPFDQLLLLDALPSSSALPTAPRYRTPHALPRLRQAYEQSGPVYGLCLKLRLYSNHGDGFYIGLDRLEVLLEGRGVLGADDLARCGGQLVAYPESINILRRSGDVDPRTPHALLSSAPRSCWLAPLCSTLTETDRMAHCHVLGGEGRCCPKENQLILQFAQPVGIAAIRVFNYSRSPRRGVHLLAVDLDDKLIYLAELRPADEEVPGQGQSMVFSADPTVLSRYKDSALYGGQAEQDVLCINERQVMVRSKAMYGDQGQSAASAANGSQRPSTSFLPSYA